MKFTINNNTVEVDDTLKNENLLHYIREDLNLTGTKNACGIGICGACLVLVDEKPVRACRRELKHVENKNILTVEGLKNTENPQQLHPLQQSFVDKAAVQCGYCIPGMLMAGHALLLKQHNPTREEIRKAINNNLCRCTGYQQIVDAIEDAAQHYK